MACAGIKKNDFVVCWIVGLSA